MFDTSYNFKLKQINPQQEKGDFVTEYIFDFKAEKRRYIFIAEEYRYKIFVVKFYPSHRKNDDLRFSLVLNDFNFQPILRTSINIMLWLLEKEPLASFGYLAAPIVTKKYKEPKAVTQRYRIYEYLMDIFIPTIKFKRVINKNNSAVLLVNKRNNNIDEFAANAIRMFIYNYPDLERE